MPLSLLGSSHPWPPHPPPLHHRHRTRLHYPITIAPIAPHFHRAHHRAQRLCPATTAATTTTTSPPPLQLEAQVQLKDQMRLREKQLQHQRDAAAARESASYNPWGRGGAGAPLRDAAGDVIASFRHNNDAGGVEAYRVDIDGVEGDGRPSLSIATVLPSHEAYDGQFGGRRHAAAGPATDENEELQHSRFRFALASPERQQDILKR